MVYYILKIVITTTLIIFITEVSKRSTFIGALLASLPFISIMGIFWLYWDTKDIAKVSALSFEILLLVLPSLLFFIILPALLKFGLNFYWSMGISMGSIAGCYWLEIVVLGRLGVKL